jgi:hypothetical protein
MLTHSGAYWHNYAKYHLQFWQVDTPFVNFCLLPELHGVLLVLSVCMRVNSTAARECHITMSSMLATVTLLQYTSGNDLH